jgi:FixJ family two-component response regulator
MSAYRNLDVALVDDDPLFLEYLTGLLLVEGGVRVRSFGSGDDLVRDMREKVADCIVLDYDLGNDNGLYVAEHIRSHLIDCPPIVMLTGGGNEKTAVKAFRNGFSDYVSKRGFSVRELLEVVERAVDRHNNQREATAEAANLRERVESDPTTSLYKEEFMRLRLAATINEKRRGFTIGIVSLEQLIAFRLELGYQTGQRLLAQYAASLRRLLTRDDVCGHLALDSFLLIEDARSADTSFANRLEAIARELARPVTIEGATVRITPRVASAWFPRDGETADELIGCLTRLTCRTETGMLGGVAAIDPATTRDQGVTGRPTQEAAIVPFEERRSERRIRTLKQGKIIGGSGQTVFDCTVRDISARGARLRIDNHFAVPASFSLDIVGMGTIRRVTTRWQVGREVGVEFTA